jgi:hypothetical protein
MSDVIFRRSRMMSLAQLCATPGHTGSSFACEHTWFHIMLSVIHCAVWRNHMARCRIMIRILQDGPGTVVRCSPGEFFFRSGQTNCYRRTWNWTTHLHLMSRLRIRGSVCPLPPYASMEWCLNTYFFCLYNSGYTGNKSNVFFSFPYQ